MAKKWKYEIGKRTIPLLLRLLASTWKVEEESVDEKVKAILSGEEPAVIAFLHGRMFPIWYRFRGGAFGGVISSSRDGELLSHYLKNRLGYHEILRGSSSRGGREVLEQMVELLESKSCMVTPDGPRGPMGEPKVGGLVAAQRSGRGVLVVNWSSNRSWHFKKSWDQMELPKPFSKIKFRYCIFHTSKKIEKINEKTLNKFKQTLHNPEFFPPSNRVEGNVIPGEVS
ncbi:MAG: lysophospholipid acyltransferase family protein [Candidatus Kapaibacterium sp.]